MPNLSFQIEGAEIVPHAASPMLAFKLRLANSDSAEIIHTVALRCQIQLEVTRRKYTPDDQVRLRCDFEHPLRLLIKLPLDCVVLLEDREQARKCEPCAVSVGETEWSYLQFNTGAGGRKQLLIL